MDSLAWAAIATALGGWSLVGYFIRLFFRGEILTRREHDEAMGAARDHAAAVTETNKHLAEQNSLMLGSSMPAFDSLLSALRQAAGEDV